MARTDVHRSIDGPAVGGTLMMAARIGVPSDNAIAVQNQPGEVRRNGPDTARHLGRRWRSIFERYHCRVAERAVDLANGNGIVLGGKPNCSCHVCYPTKLCVGWAYLVGVRGRPGASWALSPNPHIGEVWRGRRLLHTSPIRIFVIHACISNYRFAHDTMQVKGQPSDY